MANLCGVWFVDVLSGCTRYPSLTAYPLWLNHSINRSGAEGWGVEKSQVGVGVLDSGGIGYGSGGIKLVTTRRVCS